jgi:hypothetical protein
MLQSLQAIQLPPLSSPRGCPSHRGQAPKPYPRV